MAHNLNIRKNGVASFASRKEKAWHGLGTIVEAMTSKEAIELGGLNFTVEKRPLYVQGSGKLLFEEAKQFSHISREVFNSENYEGEHGEKLVKKSENHYHTLTKMNDKFATVRTDLDLPLGIVGSKYHVIQNIEAFEFIDSIVGENYAEYETVGALSNGETVFISCKLKDDMVINKDQIDKYLLLTMSHDGSSSITVMFTPIRVVCNNTLSLALEAKSNKVIIRHTKSANQKLEYAKEVLGIVDKQTLAYKIAFEAIAKIKVPDEEAQHIMQKVLKVPNDDKGQLSTKGKNILTNAWTYYNIGLGQEGIVGTGYGLFNGVTGYLQNNKDYRNDETKFKNTFMDNTVRDNLFREIISL